MAKIETERLYLYPVSNGEMEKLIAEETNEELQRAYQEMLQGCINESDKRLWYAVWYMELKDKPGTIVGDFSFKGITADGMVELGYGLRKGFYGQGYMTEAVKSITSWALAQDGVTRVEAETDPDNVASQKVLDKAGFRPTGKVGEEGPRYVRKA